MILYKKEGGKGILFSYFFVRYEILGSVELCFNLINGKLFKITALGGYSGELFGGIKIGMRVDDVLKIEPGFVYDDFEEIYFSEKGVFIETDPVEDTVLWISVYVKEIDCEDFERGEW